MCGICAVFGVQVDFAVHHGSFQKIHHRGPDAWRIEYDNRMKNSCLSFHRLAIVDSLYGMQPMKVHFDPHLTLLCNGEIYNCNRLGEELGFSYETKCDVECILHLYSRLGAEQTAAMLDGVFAFCLVDTRNRKVVVARDPYGVRPLFRLRGPKGVLGVCSEAKGLIDFLAGHSGSKEWSLDPFLPGHVEEYSLHEDGSTALLKTTKFYTIGNVPRFTTLVPQSELGSDVSANLRRLLTAAVQKRLMSERRIGCLLSGGLDSSLVAALLVKLAKEAGLTYPIQTFSIGMGASSPDVLAARKVAAHIGSEHHEVSFSEKDVAEALDEVLYHLETADITTVRASVGMYLLSRYIAERTDSTVILSGEGADEVAQGYIYFRDAPSASEGHQECLRLLQDLYMYDVLRADRTTSAHSLELRVPFLDLQFTQYFLSLPLEARQPRAGVEKYLLRQAFADTGLLPDSVLWRHKEAFSDGVAHQNKSLFTVLQELIEPRVSEEEFRQASVRFPHCTPKTKESYYYRSKFESRFPGQSHWMPYFWMPRWCEVSDPSARFISHYAAPQE